VDPSIVSAVLVGLAGVGAAAWFRRRARLAEEVAAELRRKVLVERIAARQDSLTGLLNRRAFYEFGAALLADPARRPLVAVMVDIDDFHRINEVHGQIFGDEVLVAVGRRFADYASGQLVARLGGDEFVALLTASGTGAEQHPDAGRLSQLLATPVWVCGQVVEVSVTVGVATVDNAADLSRALRRAEVAVRRAKIVRRRAHSRPSPAVRAFPEGSSRIFPEGSSRIFPEGSSRIVEQPALTAHDPRRATGGPAAGPVYCRTRVVARRRRRA
jgi:diguanylate cyclase (GGDEF)-like protein